MRFLLLILMLSFNAFGAEKFIVSPYVVLGENNKISLNFQTTEDQNLTIKVTLKNNSSSLLQTQSFNLNTLSTDFQKLDLGPLQCDTDLIYSIVSKNFTIDENHLLKSIPCNKKEPLYFGFMSDTQIKDAAGQKRADKISAFIEELKTMYPFSVIVNGGDVVQHGGRTEDWLNYFKTAYAYTHNSYIFAAVGNHDYYESETYEKAPPQFRQYLRDSASSDLGNAVLDFGRVAIIMMNSNFDYMNDATFNEQWYWFVSKLEYYQKAHVPVLVSMHHSPFSSSAEWIRPIPTKLRDLLVPTLEKYSCVKMMISGHLHMYERSIKNNLNYLVAGPSGGIVNYITYKNPYQVIIKPFSTTFSVFKVTDNQIEVTTFTGTRELIDNFKVDLNF